MNLDCGLSIALFSFFFHAIPPCTDKLGEFPHRVLVLLLSSAFTDVWDIPMTRDREGFHREEDGCHRGDERQENSAPLPHPWLFWSFLFMLFFLFFFWFSHDPIRLDWPLRYSHRADCHRKEEEFHREDEKQPRNNSAPLRTLPHPCLFWSFWNFLLPQLSSFLFVTNSTDLWDTPMTRDREGFHRKEEACHREDEKQQRDSFALHRYPNGGCAHTKQEKDEDKQARTHTKTKWESGRADRKHRRRRSKHAGTNKQKEWTMAQKDKEASRKRS